MRCALVIPTRNAGAHLDRLLPALAAQRRQPDSILVVDSRSSDDTVERFRAFGARVEVIEPASFNHGGTRRWASQQVEADALIYLTQDAIPASPDSFANLLDELYAEADIGVAYGRQLPHPGAGLLGAQARRFNYPPESRSKRLADASELGIKTCFSSDSFSAYRSDALAAVGGFPEDVIGSEDAYVAARLLQAGYAVRYAASAEVYHSHDYRLLEEFRRYFDIGVFYGRERWIRAAFGGAGGEGKRYVLAEIQALRAAGALYRVPEIALRSAFKLLGYRLGQLERLPSPLPQAAVVLADPLTLREERAVAQGLTRLVTLTGLGGECLARRMRLPPGRVEVINHGNLEIATVPLPSLDTLRLLYFGFIYRGKGIEDLLEALADLFASAPEMRQRVRLTLAGGTAAEMAFGAGGNYLDQLKAQIAELGLADAIDWNLNLAAADIPRTIQAHHVMVLPYRESKKLGLLGQQRGTSGALSWAAACGRGAITSDARAFAEEVASGNGAIYPQGDVAALSEQLLNLAREPRLAQAWAERAGAIGHARTWPRTALRFQALFNDMVGTVHGT